MTSTEGVRDPSQPLVVPRPNFFIVGAPRCGTTALSEYLRLHSGVFIDPDFKEAHYFAEDLPGWALVHTLDEYLAPFSRAQHGHYAIGEASVFYLFSRVAVARVADFDPSARLIAMLRNPVEMAPSIHAKYLLTGDEDERDFERAWRLQATRARGERIPAKCRASATLAYRDVCLLGEQVERLLARFPREQVHLVFFDDFVADTRGSYEAVLRFLGLPPDGRRDFPRINENREVRLAALGRFAVRPGPLWQAGAAALRRGLRVRRIGLLAGVRRLNARTLARPGLRPTFRHELVESFADDVRKLERLTGRDLAHWARDA